MEDAEVERQTREMKETERAGHHTSDSGRAPGQKRPAREATDGCNGCQESRLEGRGGDRLGECGTPVAGFEVALV